MNDLDERLTRHLHRQSRLIDVGAPSMVHVTRRAALRRNRRRAAVGIVGTAAVGVATIVGIQSLSRPSGKRIVPASPTATTDTSGTGPVQHAQLVDSNLVWNRFEPDSAAAIAFSFNQVATDDGFYAWSTQPGRSNSASQVLYRSTDGVSWEPIVDGTGAVQGRLAAAGDQLYSFGTTAATSAGVAASAGMRLSSDGVNWRDADLPIELGDLSGLGSDVTALINPLAFAAGDHGAMAIIDIRPKLSDELLGRLGAVQRIDATGVTVASGCKVPYPTTTSIDFGDTVPASTTPADVAPSGTVSPTSTTNVVPASTVVMATVDTANAEPCASGAEPFQHKSWSDLGVDPAAAAVFARPPHVLVSTDGQHFVAVGELPAVPAGFLAFTQAIATTDGFAVLRSSFDDGGQSGTTELLTSADGASWQSTALGVGSNSMAFGQLADGAIAFVSYVGPTPAVSIVRNGAVQTFTLDGLVTADDGPYASLQGISGGGVGDVGITLIGYVNDDPVKAAGQPSMTRDGVTITLLDSNGNVRFTDAATGAELRKPDGTSDRSTGQVTWDVVDADGSIVRFGTADVDRLYPNTEMRQPRTVVLHSVDGVSWSRDDLATIGGLDPTSPLGSLNVFAEGSKVIISAAEVPLGPSDPNAPLPKTVVMVATPGS